MLYWKWNTCWVGRLFEYPEIMTQGETLEGLEANMKDAYLLMTMDEAPADPQVKKWGKA
ncbi:MAG: type II toxin-antitoxin system HicB family antitoxin [Desulfobulbaceae bacterium]|nr:type II toxin-antitoxin system HicB family antitoxin [Desulfobulbaceae bacterium]